MDSASAEGSARIAGAMTAVLGVALLAAPRTVAEATGVSDERTLRVIAVTDLTLAPGLLLAGRKRGWLLARAAANLVAAGLLLREKAPVPRVVAVALGGLTVADLAAVAALGRPVGD